jgi:hypothetical protein
MRIQTWVLSGVVALAFAVPASAVPSITLTKTVGTAAGCATTDEITVDFGTSVNYCYQVKNNSGNTTFNLHTLFDDVLGTLVGPNQMQNLAPGQTRTEIFPHVVNTTTTNTATWTAMSSAVITYTVGVANSPAVSAMSTDFATVNVLEMGDGACDDGVDNDDNGTIDCADPGCAGAAVCRTQAPVIGTMGLVTVAILLLLIGNVALVARRRRS